MIVSASTLLQINMDPENHRVVDENSLNQGSIFTVHVGLQRGRCISNSVRQRTNTAQTSYVLDPSMWR